jgi:hypothetical protein
MADYPVRLERKITCKTYLKRLHVTNRMAELLLPPQEELTGKPSLHNTQEYTLLFKVPVSIVDAEGFLWKVRALPRCLPDPGCLPRWPPAWLAGSVPAGARGTGCRCPAPAAALGHAARPAARPAARCAEPLPPPPPHRWTTRVRRARGSATCASPPAGSSSAHRASCQWVSRPPGRLPPSCPGASHLVPRTQPAAGLAVAAGQAARPPGLQPSSGPRPRPCCAPAAPGLRPALALTRPLAPCPQATPSCWSAARPAATRCT